MGGYSLFLRVNEGVYSDEGQVDVAMEVKADVALGGWEEVESVRLFGVVS